MLETEFEAARAVFANIFEALPAQNVVAMHDVDADGIAAAVTFENVLERAGKAVTIVAPDRERNAWAPSNRRRLSDLKPEFLFVMDLGSRNEKVLEVPACFIDHHRPEGVFAGDVLISGYEWNPIPNTSWMIYELGSAICDVEGLDWIAAIGTLSDLGDKAEWPVLKVAKKKYGAKWLREATTLVNAPRRASHFRPEAAVDALREHPDPKSLCESESASVRELRAARAEVAAALDEGKKAAPTFAGNVALVRVHSPCQIHPLIAQIWRSRLPKFHVIVANDQYIAGRVNFSARSSGAQSVLDFLKSIPLSDGEGHFGHGHDAASGGSLPVARWNELLEKIGFSAEQRAA